MKVLVYRDAKKPFQAYEERYYHNLKYIITEINHDEIVDDIEGDFDIIHFIGLSSKDKINKIKKETTAKVVITYIVRKIKETEDPSVQMIPNEEIKILNLVDLVITLSQSDKTLLINNGVTNNIEVIAPGTKETKFLEMNDVEIDSFAQYASINKNEKYCLSTVSYKNSKDVAQLIQLANEFKNLKFFIFAKKMHTLFIPFATRKLLKKAPKNIKFKNFVDEDLYKSAVLGAEFLVTTSNSSQLSLLVYDAMITKTPIFAFYSSIVDDIIIDQVNAYVSMNSEQMIDQIKKYYSNELTSLVEGAFEYAKNNSIESIGEKIKKAYNSLL